MDRTGEKYNKPGGMSGSVAFTTGQQTQTKGRSTTKSEDITTQLPSEHGRRVRTDGDHTKPCRDKKGEGILPRNRTDSQGEGDTAVGTTTARAASPSSPCNARAVIQNCTSSKQEISLERERLISEEEKLNDRQNTAGMDQDPEQLKSGPGRQVVFPIDSPETGKQGQNEKARGSDTKSHRSVTEQGGNFEPEASVEGKSTTDGDRYTKHTQVFVPSEKTQSMSDNKGDHSLPGKRKYTARTKGPGSHAPYMLTLKIVVQTVAATAVDPLTEFKESSLSVSDEDYFRIYFFCINKEADADLHQLCHDEITFDMSSEQLKCTICTEREPEYLQSSTYPTILQEWLYSAKEQIIYSEIPIRGLDIRKLRDALDAKKLNAYLYFDTANPEKLVLVCKLKEERHISMHVQAIVKRITECEDPSGKGQMDTWTRQGNNGTKGQKESDSHNNDLSHEDQMDPGTVDETTQWTLNVLFLYKTAGSTEKKSSKHKHSLGEDAFLKWQYLCEKHHEIFRMIEWTIKEQLQVDTSICYLLGKLYIEISSTPELATDTMCAKVMSVCLHICEEHIGLITTVLRGLRGQEKQKVMTEIERIFGNRVFCHTDPAVPDVLISLGPMKLMGEIHVVILDMLTWLSQSRTSIIVVDFPSISEKVLEQLGIYEHVQFKHEHIKLSLDKTEDGGKVCLLESVHPDGKLKDADETVRQFLGRICWKRFQLTVLNKNAFNEHVERYFTEQFSKEGCMVPDTEQGCVNIFALDKDTTKQCFGILTYQFYETKMTIKKIKRPIEPRDVTAIEQEHEGLLSILFDTDNDVVYITGVKTHVKTCKQALQSPSDKMKQPTCYTDSDHQATEMKIDSSTDVLKFVQKTLQYQRLQRTTPLNFVFRPGGGYLLKGEPAIVSHVVKELKKVCGKVTYDMVTLHGDRASRWMKSAEGERLLADVSTGKVTVTVEYQDTNDIYGTGSEAGAASLQVDRNERQQKGTWVFPAGHQLMVMMCNVQQCDAEWIVRTDSSKSSGNRHPKEVAFTVPKWHNKERKEKHNLSVEIWKILEKMIKMSTTSIGFPVGVIEGWPFNHFCKTVINTVKEYFASQASKGMLPITVLLCTPAKDEVTRVSKMCDGALADLAEKDSIQVHVKTGSLSHFQADVLVVSVTPDLDLTKGMTAKALSSAAGPNLQKECKQKYPGKIQAGQIVHTKGHALKCKHVFYGVLPPFSAWTAKQQSTPECSKEDIENIRHFVITCLKKAEELGCSSVAFPSLGTGNLNYPVNITATEMFNAVDIFRQSNTRTAIKDIFFVLYDGDISCIRTFEDQAKKRSYTLQSTGFQRTDFQVFSTTLLKILGYPDAVCKARGHIETRLEQQGILVDRESTKWAGRQISERQSRGAEPSHAAEKRVKSKGNCLVCQVGTVCNIQIYREDIVKMKGVDFCVCRDDVKGEGNDAVTARLKIEGGSSYLQDRNNKFPRRSNEGDVVITNGGISGFKRIMHAILPHQSMVKEERLTVLGKVFGSVMSEIKRKEHVDARSLALPLIGTGKDPSLTLVQSWVNLFMELFCSFSLERTETPFTVYLVCYDDTSTEYVKKAMKMFQQRRDQPERSTDDTGFSETDDDSVHIDAPITAESNTQTVTTSMTVDEDCEICMDTMTNSKTLKCGHRFCTECIDGYFNTGKQVCPNCGTVCGILNGDQPEGTMTINTKQWPQLTGFDTCGTISITYYFPSGTQGSHHPNPGKYYKGITRTGYLPDNKKGRLIAKMLKVAFDRKLVFTIGSSRTTGEEGVITWNDIHHKTTTRPDGPFGYPDNTYLERVTEELAAKGVTG